MMQAVEILLKKNIDPVYYTVNTMPSDDLAMQGAVNHQPWYWPNSLVAPFINMDYI